MTNSVEFPSAGFRRRFRMFKSTVAPRLSMLETKQYSRPCKVIRMIYKSHVASTFRMKELYFSTLKIVITHSFKILVTPTRLLDITYQNTVIYLTRITLIDVDCSSTMAAAIRNNFWPFVCHSWLDQVRVLALELPELKRSAYFYLIFRFCQ